MSLAINYKRSFLKRRHLYVVKFSLQYALCKGIKWGGLCQSARQLLASSKCSSACPTNSSNGGTSRAGGQLLLFLFFLVEIICSLIYDELTREPLASWLTRPDSYSRCILDLFFINCLMYGSKTFSILL